MSIVWLMETAYKRRTSIPRVWHAYTSEQAARPGPAHAVCGAVILGAPSAHREPSLVMLETSYRTPRWKRVCKRCRSRAAA